MRSVAARETALAMLERFRSTGSLDSKQRESLIPPASQGLEQWIQRDLVSLKAQDEDPQIDLRSGHPGQLETVRGPSPRESVKRTLHSRAQWSDNEVLRHETATLKGETEPYQETFEFTRLGQSGIEYACITITGMGMGVGIGGIHGRAEFLSKDHQNSWLEKTYQDFRTADPLAM